MGIYNDFVMPRIVNATCASGQLDPWRQRVCAGLFGRVLEIGFGAGTNVAHYPDAVTSVTAVEPSGASRRRAEQRVSRWAKPVTYVEWRDGVLPLEDATFDAALMTFTLCTVPNPVHVLTEIRRTLRPGGALHLLEHGLAPDARVARWQHRLNGLEQRLAGGCELIRDPVELLAAAGFALDSCDQRYAGGPRPWTYFTLGVASARKFG